MSANVLGSRVKLAAVQYRPPKGRPAEARAALVQLVGEARADIVVCPEMATTGYVWASADAIRPHAETADGPTFRALSPVARAHGSWIVVGFPERAPDGLYNSALVIGPSGGLVACYRKVLLYEADHTWAKAGNTRMLCESRHGLLAPAICMDLNDPGFPVFLEESAPAVVAFATNWVDEGAEMLPNWIQQLGRWRGHFVAADSWGEDSGTRFYGRSTILGPGGVVLAAAPAEGDAVITAEVPSRELSPA
jgi:predicted amidohydrolase